MAHALVSVRMAALEAERFDMGYLMHRPTGPDELSWPGHERSRKKIWWDAGRYAQGARDQVALNAYEIVMRTFTLVDHDA